MKRIVFILILVLALCGMAQTSEAINEFQVITIADTAIGFSAISAGAIVKAFCTLETGQIRFRFDGENPTSTVGHVMDIGQYLILEKFQVGSFKAIRTGGVSGALSCSFY